MDIFISCLIQTAKHSTLTTLMPLEDEFGGILFLQNRTKKRAMKLNGNTEAPTTKNKATYFNLNY